MLERVASLLSDRECVMLTLCECDGVGSTVPVAGSVGDSLALRDHVIIDLDGVAPLGVSRAD